MELGVIVLRTFMIYFFILLMLRIMGKREIGKLSVFDLVVSIMIAELAVLSLESSEVPMMISILPILVLVFTQVILSYISLKSQKIRELVDGKPAILIENGEIKETELRKQRYNLDDLLLQLRENRIHSISQVEFAILEPSGKLTVFPKEATQPVTKEDLGLPTSPYTLPYVLIKDGKIQKQELEKIGYSEFWLKSEVKRQIGTSDLRRISFCSVDRDGNWYIDLKDR
jgi:uncharacterized membrane protein YcaP (DUF421 family)